MITNLDAYRQTRSAKESAVLRHLNHWPQGAAMLKEKRHD